MWVWRARTEIINSCPLHRPPPEADLFEVGSLTSAEWTIMKHDNKPTYLGVTLDCTLTYKRHIRNAAAKTRPRNNLVLMLAGTTGKQVQKTLRTSALALCYSVAEYCASVWRNSAHTNLVEVQLNTIRRVIINSAQCYWLGYKWLAISSCSVVKEFAYVNPDKCYTIWHYILQDTCI